jgi:DNA-binding GntR family transcriptional regulator
MAPTTKTQQLIIDDIVSGELPFGARLTIDELATRYGVSHMPIREALRELSGAGLLEIGAGRTARVRPMDPKFVDNLFATRSALEVLLVRRAAQLITPSALKLLREHEERLEACAAAEDAAGVLAANQAFHQMINAIADNPEAVTMVDRQWVLVAALWARVGYGPERFAGMINDHRHLIRAFASEDVEAASVIMGAHVIKAKYELLERLQLQKLGRLHVA